jgi:hypothetical protein
MSRPQKKQKTEDELLRRDLKVKETTCGELRKYCEVLKEEIKESNEKRLGLRRLNEGLLDDLLEAREKGNGQTGGVIYISDCSAVNRGLRQDLKEQVKMSKALRKELDEMVQTCSELRKLNGRLTDELFQYRLRGQPPDYVVLD